MSTRNGTFRKSPSGGERGGRFVLGGSTVLTSFVPVVTNGSNDGLGRAEVVLAAEGTAKPVPGFGGILVYENIDSAGTDLTINTTSDVDTVAPGRPVQVVTGDGGRVKIALTNTVAGDGYYDRSGYPKGRTMVAGASGPSATVAVGDYLLPGAGSDSAGYWKETATAADAWLRVTAVDASIGLVEAEVLI